MEKDLNPFVAGGVFLAAFATDALSSYYTRRTAEGKALQAAVASMGLLVISCITLAAFIADYRYVAFEAFGGGLGTYLTIKFDERRRQKCTKS